MTEKEGYSKTKEGHGAETKTTVAFRMTNYQREHDMNECHCVKLFL